MNGGVDAEPFPEDWLRYAEIDLTLMQVSIRAGDPAGEVCFHAQQATEKALKAWLQLQEVAPPRIHNLLILRDLLDTSLRSIATDEQLERLTQLESQSRYPGNWPEPADDEAEWASEIANTVVQSVKDAFPGLEES